MKVWILLEYRFECSDGPYYEAEGHFVTAVFASKELAEERREFLELESIRHLENPLSWADEGDSISLRILRILLKKMAKKYLERYEDIRWDVDLYDADIPLSLLDKEDLEKIHTAIGKNFYGVAEFDVCDTEKSQP